MWQMQPTKGRYSLQLLFSMFIEEVITILEKDGLGRWVGNQYYCITIIYAGGMFYFPPSLTGFQNMIDRCLIFGSSHGLSFNAKKTICVDFNGTAKCPVLTQYKCVPNYNG